jgi:hypothetical protein
LATTTTTATTTITTATAVLIIVTIDKTTNFPLRKSSIESRLNRLEQTAAATLQGFYEPHLLSFQSKPGSANVKSVNPSMIDIQIVKRGLTILSTVA